MSVRSVRFASSENPVASGAGDSGSRTFAPAVIWGRNDETRLLLRGLLRLHRHPVVFEAETPAEMDRLPASSEPRLLLYDIEAGDGAWARQLTSALERHPELRAIVILPSAQSTLEPEARRAGARRVLLRPFAIIEFAQALERTID